MSAGTWVLERREDGKFPYRIQILNPAGRPLLVLLAQDRWPAANRNIFCLRQPPDSPEPSGDEIERVPILAFQRRGVRVSVVLDRSRYKRCDFLFLKRSYKNRPAESYEQIFWQTQTSMVQHRPKIVPPALRSRQRLTIAVDVRERYPWRFPGSDAVRRRLDSGDYALMDGDTPVAVVERKTLDNMLADFGVMPLLHQRLMELAVNEHHALVIEAPYEDFLNPARVHHYSSAFCAATIADLYVAHPRLRIVFCANRKAANAWTSAYFAAAWQKHGSRGNREPEQESARMEPPS